MDTTPTPRSLLLVEDDEALCAYLCDNLAADGFRVTAATGVGEGLRAIEHRQPDLVVLDLMLEDGNGLAILDRVRSADGLASRLDPSSRSSCSPGAAPRPTACAGSPAGPTTTS